MSPSLVPCIRTPCHSQWHCLRKVRELLEIGVLIEDSQPWRQDLMVCSLACVWIKCDWPASSSYLLLPHLLCPGLRLWSQTPDQSFLFMLLLFIMFYHSNRDIRGEMLFTHSLDCMQKSNNCALALTLKMKKILPRSKHRNTDACLQFHEIKSMKFKPSYT